MIDRGEQVIEVVWKIIKCPQEFVDAVVATHMQPCDFGCESSKDRASVSYVWQNWLEFIETNHSYYLGQSPEGLLILASLIGVM